MEPSEVENRANAHAVEETVNPDPTPVLYDAPTAPVLQAKPEPFLVANGSIPETIPPEQQKPLPLPPPYANGKMPGELTDLGWNDHVDRVPEPLVKGMSNEDVWTLVRRFDKVRSLYSSFFKMLIWLLANVSRQSDPTAGPRPARPQHSG